MARRMGSRPATPRPVLATLAALLIAALSTAGCVSMPTGGPVQSYPVAQGTDAPNQPFVQVEPQAPRPGWSPQQIVRGFLIASASFGAYSQVVQQYLTPLERQSWNPAFWAIVYKSGPKVEAPSYLGPAKNPTTASVAISGNIQAALTGNGSYSVPSTSGQNNSLDAPPPFELKKVDGQWRIFSAPQELLLTGDSFANDYQLRNLYFFDPQSRYLVPDPVYLPLGAKPTDLINALVHDLITPPDDWLSQPVPGNPRPTKTAFPSGTKIGSVGLGGVTAFVNLTGTITKATTSTMQQVSAQLLSTLEGALQGELNGQSVQSVEVMVNGNPWYPPGGQNNPVQGAANPQYPQYAPPTGASPTFYYLDSAGYLVSRPSSGTGRPTRLAKLGTQYRQIAVSADGEYVAALRGNDLYAGRIGDPLPKRGSGYVAMSWDGEDNLWASTGDRVNLLRRATDTRQPLGQTVAVNMPPGTGPFTLLRVAPDGVRIAMVQGSDTLTFGAISGEQGPQPQITFSLAQDAPPAPAQGNATSNNFAALAWYGPDDVIALATLGPTVTEYPVSGGGNLTSGTAESGTKTIAASYKQPLIAGLPQGGMQASPGLNGTWMPVGNGDTPVNGSSPTYPG